MTALLLPPAREYVSPPLAWRRDTGRRWRQLTKLPRPFPQYPPFILRYGYVRCAHIWRRCQRRPAIQVSLVPLM